MTNVSEEKVLRQESDVVQLLRIKTEEEDMKNYLKTSFGGYTKQSVLDYINVLKRNQQAMADTFNQNQESLFEEKEQLKKNNEMLQSKVSKIEGELESLSKNMISVKQENQEYLSKHIPKLKDIIASLEMEMDGYKTEIKEKSSSITELEEVNFELRQQLENEAEEVERLNIELKSEKDSDEENRKQIDKLIDELKEATAEAEKWQLISVKLEKSLEEANERLSKEIDNSSNILLDVEAKEEKITELTGEVKLLEQELANSRNELIVLNNKILELDKQKQEQEELLQAELKKNKSKQYSMEYTIKELHNTNEKLSLEFQQLKEALDLEKEKVKDAEGLIKQVEQSENQRLQLEYKLKNLTDELERQTELLATQSLEGKQKEQEVISLAEKLDTLEEELYKQVSLAEELNTLLEAEKQDVEHWKALLEEERRKEDLEWKINELTIRLEAQEEIIANQEAEGSLREETIISLTEEINSLKGEIGSLMETIEAINNQKERLVSANSELRGKLSEIFKYAVELINEKSQLTVDNSLSSKKLTEAKERISMLELQVSNNNRKVDLNKVDNVIYRKFVE